MKRITIKNLAGEMTHSAMMEDPTDWVDQCVETNAWGLKSRWVPHRDEVDSPGYQDADVLEEETQFSEGSAPKKWVKLRATYTIEIEDVTADYENQQVIQSRIQEYPTAEEFLDAYFDGGEAALASLQAKRLAVKAKYPKSE